MAGVILLGLPSVSRAEGEVTGVIGGLLGGDLKNVLFGNVSAKGAFDNGPLYGVRAGWIARFFGVEGSFVTSPSGVNLDLPNAGPGVNAKVYYLEANALWIMIPGPVSPFLTGGVGLHSYDFDTTDDLKKMGYNFGGGLKINIKAITLRGEVRDHVTPFEQGDFRIGDIISAVTDGDTLHNIEISGGIGVRF
jgi:opacity protein-like surface antigen